MAIRNRLLAGVAALSVAVSGQPAYAWKPKTHVYLAEEALRDALDNGKVTIYETDHATGKIIGQLGEFDVDPKILAALRAAPAQFRAGVLGPDAYPDILTGQQIIHPDEALAHDGSASGTDAWLTHIWRRGFLENGSPQVQAFAIGYLTHGAGDIFAHTFVNHFSGGEFMLVPDPTNAVKHLVLEGYIGKRTPDTQSAFTTRVRTGGGPRNQRKRDDLGLDPDVSNDPITYADVNKQITQADVSISGVEDFIYRELTYATPGSPLDQRLLKGGGTSRSIPFIYSTLRNGLQKQVEDYDRIRLSKTGPDRLAYAAANGPAAEYKRAWVKDIDAGLAALPGVSHKVATAIVYNEQGSDMSAAKAAMDQYVVDHMASMSGVPDGLVATVNFIGQVMDAISPTFLKEAIAALMKAPIDALVKGATGKTAEEWSKYLKNPETHFDEIMNRPGGGHDGAVDHPISLETFNRQYLKLDDKGYQNPSLKWKIEELPPAFNTLQLTKMLMLGDGGMQQLSNAIAAKGAPMGASPGQFRNHMLGWVRSLDAGNQWQGLPSHKPGPSPLPAFAKGGGQAAFYKLFLAQTGETGIAPQAEHGSSPVPSDQAPQDQPAPPPTSQPSTQPPPPPGQATGSAPPVSGTGAGTTDDWGAPRPGGGATTPPPAPPPPLPAAPAAFQSLRNFDVRLDRTQSDGAIVWAFVTFKNTSGRDQWMTSGIVRVLMEDADGVATERNQFWRPQNPPSIFAGTPLLAPGSELKARFRFTPDAGARPAAVILRDGDATARFPIR